jgi:hypothetical protein
MAARRRYAADDIPAAPWRRRARPQINAINTKIGNRLHGGLMEEGNRLRTCRQALSRLALSFLLSRITLIGTKGGPAVGPSDSDDRWPGRDGAPDAGEATDERRSPQPCGVSRMSV